MRGADFVQHALAVQELKHLRQRRIFFPSTFARHVTHRLRERLQEGKASCWQLRKHLSRRLGAKFRVADPEVEIRPVRTQMDDVLSEINLRVALQERVLITTLTKRMAEDLTDYLHDDGARVRYLHSYRDCRTH